MIVVSDGRKEEIWSIKYTIQWSFMYAYELNIVNVETG